MKYRKVSLKNGSALGIVSIPGAYPVTISAFVKAGFRHDPPSKPGLAHFTEHMLFNGSKNYPSSAKLAQAVNQVGGWHGAFTWIEYQQHTVHLPKDNLELGVKVLLDTLTNPLVDKEGVEKEKGVIKEEILRDRINPEKAIWDYAWQPLFFEGTNLGRPYSGLESDIAKFQPDDVNKFINGHFLAASTIFLVAGNVSAKRAVNIFEEYVRDYAREGSITKPVEISSTSRRVKIVPRDLEQSTIMCGIRTVPFADEERHVLDLVVDLLGGYFGSILPQRLRDKNGLIYTWYMWQDNLDQTGYLYFKTSTATENIYKVVKIVLDELAKLANKKIAKKEFDIAKGHAVGSLLSNIQSGADFVNWYGVQEIFEGKSMSLEERAEIYKAISRERVMEICEKYFAQDNIYITVVGKADEAKLVELIKKSG